MIAAIHASKSTDQNGGYAPCPSAGSGITGSELWQARLAFQGPRKAAFRPTRGAARVTGLVQIIVDTCQNKLLSPVDRPVMRLDPVSR